MYVDRFTQTDQLIYILVNIHSFVWLLYDIVWKGWCDKASGVKQSISAPFLDTSLNGERYL